MAYGRDNGGTIKDRSLGPRGLVGVTWGVPLSLYDHVPSTGPGKGRGRQVIAVARTADVVIMMLDATKGEVQRSAGWYRGQANTSGEVPGRGHGTPQLQLLCL